MFGTIQNYVGRPTREFVNRFQRSNVGSNPARRSTCGERLAA